MKETVLRFINCEFPLLLFFIISTISIVALVEIATNVSKINAERSYIESDKIIEPEIKITNRSDTTYI